ncbi:MAG: chorismate synthase [Bacteroidales bacterium]|nr:chorismate synthase [Bacteroidales bacterium]
MAAANTLGHILHFTSFGESHGPAIGGVIDGFPAGFKPDMKFINSVLQMRSPQGSLWETERKEKDEVEILSGMADGKTLGSPIAFIFRNSNTRSGDYDEINKHFRPGHADYTYFKKYGIDGQSGGGRASGRETVARVFAGALAMDFLRTKNIEILSFVSAIGSIQASFDVKNLAKNTIESSVLRCPDSVSEQKMLVLLENLKKESDSIGGGITSIVRNLPAGLGEPLFAKINAVLSQAVMSIPAVKAVEFGAGMKSAEMKGSEFNDSMSQKNGEIHFESNNSGGIQGGISNGNDLVFTTWFRPPSSHGQKQKTISRENENSELEIKGRHDVCFVPRAVPVVFAMTALSVLDLLLLNSAYQNQQ